MENPTKISVRRTHTVPNLIVLSIRWYVSFSLLMKGFLRMVVEFGSC
jgi:hypothetical protein